MQLDQRTARKARALGVLLALGVASLLPRTARAQDTFSADYISAPDAIEVSLWRPQLRFGVSGVGGGFVGLVQGGSAGVAPRIGVQLDRVVAIFMQVHGLIGNFDSSSGGSRVAGFLYHELMFDLTAIDRLQFGLGPSLDFMWNCQDENACHNGEARFGGDARIALVLGDDVHAQGSRRGLSLSLEVHPTWLDPDFTWMMLFGIGGEMF